ncbi:hypothetical protein GCM10010341_58430 [Streptomyces noursei]|nr:hypothetical protein GCM10010341_58430 [Streptomyces noursei]
MVAVAVAVAASASRRTSTRRPWPVPASRRDARADIPLGIKERLPGAGQPSERISGRLVAVMRDAVSGMVIQVCPPRQDELNAHHPAFHRALPLCDPATLRPNRHTGDTNA